MELITTNLKTTDQGQPYVFAKKVEGIMNLKGKTLKVNDKPMKVAGVFDTFKDNPNETYKAKKDWTGLDVKLGDEIVKILFVTKTTVVVPDVTEGEF